MVRKLVTKYDSKKCKKDRKVSDKPTFNGILGDKSYMKQSVKRTKELALCLTYQHYV